MPELAVLAFIGLLLLLPLEFFLLMLLGSRKRYPEPVLNLPEVKKPARYGWEDYIELPKEVKAPSSNGPQIVMVCIIVLVALLLIGPAYFFFPNMPHFANASSNVSGAVPIINVTPPVAVPKEKLNVLFFSNFSVSHGFSMPIMNLTVSGPVGSYKPYVITATVAIVLLLISLVVFILILKAKRQSVIVKAKTTAEKLIKKAEPAAPPKIEPAKAKGNYSIPLIALFAIVVIAAVLIYLFRSTIKSRFLPWLYQLLSKTIDFIVLYRFYIATGVVLLVIIVAALRYAASRRK